MNVYGCPNSLDELEIRLGDMLTGALHSQRSSSVSLQLAAPRSQRRTVLVLQFSCEAFVYIITLRPHLSYIVYTYPRVCVCVCVCREGRSRSSVAVARTSHQLQERGEGQWQSQVREEGQWQERVLSCSRSEGSL